MQSQKQNTTREAETRRRQCNGAIGYARFVEEVLRLLLLHLADKRVKKPPGRTADEKESEPSFA